MSDLDHHNDPENAPSFLQHFLNLIPFWKAQRKDWKVTVVRTSLDRLAYKIVLPYLSLYLVALGASKSQLGVITSIGMLVMGLIAPFVGGWIDRNGARRVYSIGIIITFIAYVIYALAPNWQTYAVAMVLYYFGNGLSMQSCVVICGGCLKSCDRGKGMLICESFAAGALGMIGPMIGAWIFTHLSGVTDSALAVPNDYRPLFYASAFFTAISFFVVWLHLSNARMGKARSSGFALRDAYEILKRNKNARKWIFISAVGQLPVAMIVPYISVFAAEYKLATPAVLAAMLTSQSLTSILLGHPVGILADHFGRKKVLFVLVPTVWAALILLMLAPVHSVLLLLLAGFLLGCLDIWPPLFGAVQMEIMNPGSMGVWFGTTRLTNAIVAAVMAIVAGVTYDRLGPVWTFSIFIACDAFIRMPLLASIPETLGRAMTDEEAHADPR